MTNKIFAHEHIAFPALPHPEVVFTGEPEYFTTRKEADQSAADIFARCGERVEVYPVAEMEAY